MVSIARQSRDALRRPAAGGGASRLLAIPVVLILALAAVTLLYVIYVLWPRWPEPPVSPDAPSLPITVGGVTFSVPPAAIRVAVQRRAGAQERIDLAYLWPSLTPPDPATKAGQTAPATPGDRLFVTIAASDGILPPAERLKAIYPRYVEPAASAGPDGLGQVKFRDGSPYQGEDLLFDPAAPEQFLLRCTRKGKGPMPGSCLHERRIGTADVTVRFPRDWLSDWRSVQAGVERLMTQLRPQGG
jgi:hypothetical protein